MHQSPLILKDYYLEALAFETNVDYEDAGVTVLLELEELKVEIRKESAEPEKERGRLCQIRIETNVEECKLPYEFSITVIGLFKIAPFWEDSQKETLFESNAPALLYSSARDIVSTLTARGYKDKMILPSVTFIDFSSSIEKDSPDPSPKKKGKRTKQITKESS